MGNNSKEPFGDNSGKKYIETQGDQDPIVANLDIKNAVRLRFIEGLAERAIELSEEIQENIDREASRPIEIPLGRVGTGLFELQAMTLSFYEASGWILTIWALEVEVPAVDDFIDYFRHEHWMDDLQGVSSREKEKEIVRSYLRGNGGAFEYIDMFAHAEVIDSDFQDLLHGVREDRNDFVHHPLKFMSVREGSEVLALIANCVTVVEQTEELLHSDLPIDDTFYRQFSGE